MSQQLDPAVRAGTPAEPAEPVRRRWIAALSLATLGMSMAVLTPIQVLLPAQIEAIDADRKVFNLAWVTTIAAIASVLACPVAGALSDRTRSRFGRRRPWVLGSAILCAVMLTVLGAQQRVATVALCWVTVQIGINALYAALSAAVPDRVPSAQRGVVSAWAGVPVPLALIVGSFLVAIVVRGRFSGYLMLAILLLVLVLPYLAEPDPTPPAAPPRVRGPVRAPSTRDSAHDIRWAFGCRFAIQLANAVGTLYLLYYLRDVLHRPDPAASVFVLIVFYTAGIVLTSVVAGYWSDRTGRRKPFVIASAVVVAIAMLAFGLGHSWGTAMLAAVIMGVGYGIYIAVDNALITQVLPSARNRARDLGIVNLANTGPQAVAPALAGAVISTLGGYTTLYLLAGGCALAGAALIQPVRRVR